MFMKRDNGYSIKVCLVLISVAIVGVIVNCFSNGISGNDFWWHIKVGEYICNTKTVPTKDIFSWYGIEKGIAWTAHEWLAEVIFFAIFSSWGSLGIFLFAMILALLMTFLLMYQTRKDIKRNVLICGVFLILFSVIASAFFYGRPHVFSYFLLFFELKILYDFYEDKSYKQIYLLPIIAVLWSNLHGGSSNLSYILCVLFMIVSVVRVKIGKIESEKISRRKLITLAIVAVACVIGILINPVGLKVLAYPYESFRDQLSMSLISEWQAPDAKNWGNVIFYFFPILLMSFGIVSNQQKIRFIDMLLTIIFLFLFFRSTRFIILWYIAASFCMIRYTPNMHIKPITTVCEKITVLGAICLLLIPIAVACFEIKGLIQSDTLITKVMSEEAISVIKEDAPGRIYNDYNLGEALIYNEILVFFDARADLYVQENIMADGASLGFLRQFNDSAEEKYVDVDAILQKYNFDAIVILKQRPLYSYLISHPEQFIKIYEDEEIAYFTVSED